MSRGVVILENANQTLYLPVFHKNRNFVYEVLTNAILQLKPGEKEGRFHQGTDFFEMADAIGRDKSGSDLFIGPESIPYETPASIIATAEFVFAVNFQDRKIVIVK